MKTKISKKIISTILAMMVLIGTGITGFTASALDSSGMCGDTAKYSFDKSSGTLTISGYGSISDNYSYYDDNFSFFYYDDSIRNIVIEEGITNIGAEAFRNCKNLKNVIVAGSVIEIDAFAFMDCTSLESVQLPDKIQYIGDSAFGGCENLTNISFSVPSDFDGEGVLDSAVFQNCEKLTEITLPVNLVEIGSYEFWGCKSLTKIEIPNSVSYIWNAAFFDCENLQEITIPDGVRSIGPDTFVNCSSLSTVVIPKSVIVIDEDAFWCENLKDVYYGGTKSDWDCISISEGNEYLLNANIHFIDDPQPPVSESIVKTSTDNRVSCTYDNGVFGTGDDSNLVLKVEEIGVGTSEFSTFQTVISDGNPVAAYSIKIVDKNNNVCQPQNGQSVTVKIKIPEGIKTTDTIFIYHKKDNGTNERIKMTSGDVKFENGYIVFNTTSFSDFIVVKEHSVVTPKVTACDDFSLNYKASGKVTYTTDYTSKVKSVEFNSSNSSVVSVDNNGNVKGAKSWTKGTATITCTVTFEDGKTASDSCNVTCGYTWWQWIIGIVLFGWIWY